MRYEERGFVIFAFTVQGCQAAEKVRLALQRRMEQEHIGGSAVICIGRRLKERIWEARKKREDEAWFWSEETSEEKFLICQGELQEWIGKNWNCYQGMIFVSATGIAVRMIAPFLQNKKTDPAVVVLDERGTYCISLVSGHLGGANELAIFLAEGTGAIPVITTATDVEKRFAIDLFAKENGLKLTDMTLAKEITAELLHGGLIGLYTGLPLKGTLPRGLVRVEKREELERFSYGVEVAEWSENNKDPGRDSGKNQDKDQGKDQGNAKILKLQPRNLVLGLGCRRGTSAEALLEAVKEAEGEGFFSIEEIGMIASIDLKAKEQGLLELAADWEVPFVTFSAEELLQVQEVSEESEFVRSITGVGNVCERAAMLGAEADHVEVKKQKYCGITLSAARKRGSIRFE